MVESNLFFKQIRNIGDNFSYIIADENSKEAVVVDPSFNSEAIIRLAKKNGLRIEYIIDTHHHRDHIADNKDVKARTGAKIIAHKISSVEKDIEVTDGDTVKIGQTFIKVLYTPGHTQDSISLLVDKKVLTGDTLFVGECGRTDLPGSSSKDMYNSLFNKLMKLDDDVEVYPGHDYGQRPHSTIGEEKKTNYVLERRSQEEFIEFMRR
ncbi:MAG: hydroxyacylglutathione hydrolase [Thermoproteota archaeon]|nr:hydroxyacylglutathione hydrolase [Thermoproteota archaeon]